MNLRVKTNYEELIIEVVVRTASPQRIRIKAYDEERTKAVYTDRYMTVNGMQRFIIRMPLSRKYTIVEVYNEANGNLSKGQDPSFKVLKLKKLPLVKRTDVSDIRDVDVRNFVDLAQRFAFNSSYLKTNEVYKSQNGKFLIDYLPYITSNRTGQKLATPARISAYNGHIQISKEGFDKYTVPMRMAILLHEYAHFYRNRVKSSEIEADLNALLIYLSLGYPRIEAYQAFLEVFKGTPSPQNKQRYDILNKFIRDFENKKMILN